MVPLQELHLAQIALQGNISLILLMETGGSFISFALVAYLTLMLRLEQLEVACIVRPANILQMEII